MARLSSTNQGLLLAPTGLLVVLPFALSLAVLLLYSVMDRLTGGLQLQSWTSFLTDPYYWSVAGKTLRLAITITAICILVAYPTALALSRVRSSTFAAFCYLVLFTPLLMSTIVRAYGWILLLSGSGLVNQLLALVGIGPVKMMQNEIGVIVAMVHVLIPFAVLPLLSIFRLIPADYADAARDMGASSLQAFVKVTLPMSLPGILVASQIVFALSISAFVTPNLLGGGRVTTLAGLVYENVGVLEWSLAAVMSLVLLAIAIIALILLDRLGRSTYGAR